MLSSVILFFSAFAFAWPPSGFYAVLTGDPDRWRYGAIWMMTMTVPFVAVAVVRWFSRKRVALSRPAAWTRAALLALTTTAIGLYALYRGLPGILAVPIAPFAVAFATLLVWVAGWKLADLRRPLRVPPPRSAYAWVSTGGPAFPNRSRGPSQDRPAAPRRPAPQEVWWAYVPLETLHLRHRWECVRAELSVERDHLRLPTGRHTAEPDLPG